MAIDGRSSPSSDEVIARLTRIGLTTNQAKVYVSALKLGMTTTRDITGSCGLENTTVRRNIDELIKLGLLRKDLGVPNQFTACKPEECLALLEERLRAQLDQRITIARSLSTDLGNLGSWPYKKEAPEDATIYRLLKTERELDFEGLRLLGSAEHEIMLLAPSRHITHLPTSEFAAQLDDAKRRCVERGVKFRMIVQGGGQEQDASPWSSFCEVRYHSQVGFLLAIYDRKVLQMGPDISRTYDPVKKHPQFVCMEELFVEGFAQFFDHLWEESSTEPTTE